MSRWYIVLFIVLLVGNILVYQAIFAPNILKVTVLDVGKGSAALVQIPNNKTFLIDAGPDASILRALGATLPMWQRKIGAVILTGTKSALVGGLPALESRYHIGNRIDIGSETIPYGASLMFDNSRIKIISPGTFTISYGTSVFNISSSTPAGVYISDGQTVTKN